MKIFDKEIPKGPGVYLFKDKEKRIIYIGKAKSLAKRVPSYFRKASGDFKREQLTPEIADVEFIQTPTETEAMLLEASLIQEHKPKFNLLFKEGQPFLYICCSQHDALLPQLIVARNKKEGGICFGPFLHKTDARQALAFLQQTFRLRICNKTIKNGCLNYHLGSCPGTCMPDFDSNDYYFNLQLALDVLKNNHDDFIAKIKEKIDDYSRNMKFEQARRLTKYLGNIDVIFKTIQMHFSPQKFATDIAAATLPRVVYDADQLARQLQELLGLNAPVTSIDCFDISHFQSKSIVGSCIRFTKGDPDKNKFRRFMVKSLEKQNDYAALQEVVMRRYKDKEDFPDLILIDGGKGQLSAVEHLYPQVPRASLAKREERLYSSKIPEGILLDIKTGVGKTLIALRDYAHHFAVSYHRLKRRKEYRESSKKNERK